MATVSLSNVHKQPPRWFRKTKRALTIACDGAIVFLLALGYSESSLYYLIARVGISTALQVVEAVLAEDDEVLEEPPNNARV